MFRDTSNGSDIFISKGSRVDDSWRLFDAVKCSAQDDMGFG
jgi:hypothetical protein